MITALQVLYFLSCIVVIYAMPLRIVSLCLASYLLRTVRLICMRMHAATSHGNCQATVLILNSTSSGAIIWEGAKS